MQTALPPSRSRGASRLFQLVLLLLVSGCAVAPPRPSREPVSSAGQASTPPPSVVAASAPASKIAPAWVPSAPAWEKMLPELVVLRAQGREPEASPFLVALAAGEEVEVLDSEGLGPIVALTPLADPLCVVVPDRREVKDLILEFTTVQRSTFTEALRRSGRYLPLIRTALAEESLPQELAYLSLVESSYLPDARSVSGALGLWQFMEPTARDYGLRVDRWADERLDPEAATRAAARHLGDLYARFGDWNLAAAAYNAGSGGVGRARDRHSAESFWDLYGVKGLRDQTCRYVVKFLAAIAIASDPEAYGLKVGEPEPPLAYDTVWADSPVLLRTVARLASAPEAEIRKLNPALLRGVTPPGAVYPVHVPPGTREIVTKGLRELPERERVALVPRRVKKGESASSIAMHYGMTKDALLAFNGLGKRKVRAGEELWIPVEQGFAAVEAKAEPRAEAKRSERTPAPKVSKQVHVVKKGETLWSIARRYGVEPGDLVKKNGKAVGGSLKPGDRLFVVNAEKGDRKG